MGKTDIKLEVSNNAILESISDGVFTVDKNWRITSFNRAAEEITGIPRSEALGSLCSEVFRSSMCENDCALRRTLSSKKPLINQSCYIINAKGEKIPISISTAVLRDREGNICGGAETFRDLREIQTLRQELARQYKIGDLISRSPAMQDVFKLLPVIASSSSTILIQGETGTGKELLARAIHSMSKRNRNAFIAINCAALPDTLLESELFGYKKGAFTGADRDKPGLFAAADKGTLLLDEIGDVSPALQVKLLRVLQQKEYIPLGSNRPVSSDVRIIAATNKDLFELVQNGEFRQDLYYRINVINLSLPPLRDRKEDIPLLAEHFIERFNHLQNRNIKSLSPQTLSIMMAHDWQGNIRELENVIERAFVLCQNEQIQTRHLPAELTGDSEIAPSQPLQQNRLQAEKQIIISALKEHEYNRNAAARSLGIHKSTLYRKIKKLNITLPESDRKPPKR